MRIKEGFVLREVAGQVIVIATGEASKHFHGMLKLNATGKDIWIGLQKGLTETEIVEDLQKKYQVEREQIEQDVKEFFAQITEMGFLEYE